jgi:hypothetical protein
LNKTIVVYYEYHKYATLGKIESFTVAASEKYTAVKSV